MVADPKIKHNQQVRRTRGEGFGSTSGCWQPQNGADDFAVRSKDQHKRYTNKQQSYCIDCQILQRSVSAGQLQNGGHVTEEVVNLARVTETQRKNLAHLPYLHWDSTDPGAHSQLEARLWGHDQGIVQGVTDGHAAVIGHHRQEEALSSCQYKEEAHLGSTGQHRNAPVLSPEVHQDPRESDGHVTDFQGGKICQEKIHGFLQSWVKPSYYY